MIRPNSSRMPRWSQNYGCLWLSTKKLSSLSVFAFRKEEENSNPQWAKGTKKGVKWEMALIVSKTFRMISYYSYVLIIFIDRSAAFLMRKWEILMRMSEFLTFSWYFLNGFKWNHEKFWRFHENFSLSH